jgi:twitching motility protein PilI
MAKRLSLREFQEGLASRLKAAASETAAHARLSFQAGETYWLVGLESAGEVLPVPEVERVPLTRTWFAGVTNLRGVLYGISDFSAFLGGPATVRAPENRLLLIGEPLGVNAALLVTRLTGLRNVDELEVVEDEGEGTKWAERTWRDGTGRLWRDLDGARLLSHRDFLDVGID